MIYIDMDGTIDDFRAWVATKTDDLSGPSIEATIVTYYQECYKDHPLIERNRHLLTDFEDFRILSAIPSTKTLLKYCKAEDLDVIMSTLRENKLAYMERLGVHRSNVIITNGSKEKKLYAKKGEVLYDDYKKNIDEWISYGGSGVLVE